MKLSVFSFEQHHFKWIPWHCYQVRPCSSVIAVSELLDLLEMETDALADPFTTLSGRWISIGSSATFPDNNREKVQYEKSNLKYLIWQATLEQINGTLPISCLCRVLSIGCPSHHSIAWKLLFRNNLCWTGWEITELHNSICHPSQVPHRSQLIITSWGHPRGTCSAAGWYGRSSSFTDYHAPGTSRSCSGKGGNTAQICHLNSGANSTGKQV